MFSRFGKPFQFLFFCDVWKKVFCDNELHKPAIQHAWNEIKLIDS